MTVDEQAVAGVVLPAGLRNIGNTCYANSTIQCLRNMPELRFAIKNAVPSQDPMAQFAKTLVSTCEELDNSGQAVVPASLINVMRRLFPLFSAGVAEGRPQQQDAEELYNALAQSISVSLAGPSLLPATTFDSLLGIEMETTLQCEESADEAKSVGTDKVNKLVCNVQGSQQAGDGSSQIDHVQEGLMLGLEGKVEKNSDVLGRNALWKKSSRISKLPRYLCIQFMRFFWKATPDSRDHAGVKCKIMRKVSFPDTLDVYDFCSPALQAALKANRDKEDKKIEEEMASKRAKLSKDGQEEEGGSMEVSAAEQDEDEDETVLKTAMSMSVGEEAPTSVFKGSNTMSTSDANSIFIEHGLPAGFTGLYELHSIVTHKGRDSDGGHYIGWVRKESGGSQWYKYNDDKVTEHDQAEILMLCGGGDRDIAYLTFYRYKEPLRSKQPNCGYGDH